MELLPADLERSVPHRKGQGWITCVVGLDIRGAFDSASPAQLVDALREYSVPEPMSRFIENWLTGRSFRIKLGTTCGVVCRGPRTP